MNSVLWSHSHIKREVSQSDSTCGRSVHVLTRFEKFKFLQVTWFYRLQKHTNKNFYQTEPTLTSCSAIADFFWLPRDFPNFCFSFKPSIFIVLSVTAGLEKSIAHDRV